jgi:hypothetical protein
MKRIAVKHLVDDETKRGQRGVFGVVAVNDGSGGSYVLEVSRLDGEEMWIADSVCVDGIYRYRNEPGDRSRRRCEVLGRVREAIQKYAGDRS